MIENAGHISLDIVGVGPTGPKSLSGEMLSKIVQADILYAGKRLMTLFEHTRSQRVLIDRDLGAVTRHIVAHPKAKKVLLATGDPNFFGIADYLYRHLGADRVTVWPHLSSLQLFFARIKMSWHDVFLASVHGRSADAVLEWVKTHEKVFLLTDPVNTPQRIAELLVEGGFGESEVIVGQDLGMPLEAIWRSPAWAMRAEPFSPLNVLLILNREANRREDTEYGIADREFDRRPGQSGLITKQDIRAVSLSRLRLFSGAVVWDVGAGSGSVAVEAAALVGPAGRVYALERNPEDIERIRSNARRWRRPVVVVAGEAPEAFKDLPDPDAIFVGGSGGRLEDILITVLPRIRPEGRLVINLIDLNHVEQVHRILARSSYSYEILLVQVSKAESGDALLRLRPENPVWIVVVSPKANSVAKGEGE